MQHGAVASALFRHIDDPMRHRIAGAADADLAVFQHDTAARRPGDAEERLRELRTPSTDKAINTEDFTLAQLKRNAAKFGRMRIVFNLQHGLADGDILLRKSLLDGAPDHHAHDIILPRIGQCAVSDSVTVAENGIIVGDFINFIELVADEQDGLSLRLQPRHDAEQIVHFLARKRSGGLIHDDDA